MNLPRRLLMELIKRSNSDLKSVSERIGKNHAYLQQYIMRGTPRRLSEEVRSALGEVLGVSPDVFREEDDPERTELDASVLSRQAVHSLPLGRIERTMAQQTEYRIPEYMVLPETDGDSSGVPHPACFWSFPREVVDSFVPSPSRLVILRVTGDSMVPDYMAGERVLVDMGNIIPSPPGVYVVSDGLNPVLRRVEVVFGSDPVIVRLMSHNPVYATYECPLPEVRIYGRVIGKWSWK